MITKASIEKIKDYARIEEVVGDFVRLKRAGSNLTGLCPFHNEKTSSFVVSPAKGLFKCFGCGKSGDSIGFVIEHEKLSYPEAIRYLGNRYNIELEEIELSEDKKQEQSLRESIFIALNFAANWFAQQLNENEEGKAIGYSYFKERGFLDETIQSWKLGYTPTGSNHFLEAALVAGYTHEVLKLAGLAGEKDGKWYDFFRERVMFPILNVSGKVAGFGGRIMNANSKVGKYINTPETEVYNKSKILFGLFQSKAQIRKLDVAYLVEGYTDVISLHQAGITNVVASSGTSLTVDQVKLIKRFTENVVIIYDGDSAGIKAALRGLDLVIEEGLNVKLVLLPDGDDPDSMIRKVGTAQMEKFIEENQKDFIFFKAEILMGEAKNDPIKKAGIIKDIVHSISLIPDQIKTALYIQECSRLMEIQEEVLIREFNKLRRTWVNNKTNEKSSEGAELLPENTAILETPPTYTSNPQKALDFQERDIIRILFLFGNKSLEDNLVVANFVLDEIGNTIFNNELYQKGIEYFKLGIEKNTAIEKLMDFIQLDESDLKTLVIDLLTSPYEISNNWLAKYQIIVKDKELVFKQDVKSSVNRYLFTKVNEILNQVDKLIKDAQTTNDMDKALKLLKKKRDFQVKRKELALKLGTVVSR
ncbi:MAG: DNA primase [Bacteroidetes bacterium]|jgi:DNA primase|nr:DNA primase [Bacteroidota bacterium]MBL0286979.1 DNA primase [Bacteroidota bacterium]